MTKPLHFKSVEIHHREILQPYLTKNSRTCDRTFNNLFCWQHYYRTAWAEQVGANEEMLEAFDHDVASYRLAHNIQPAF